MNDFPLPIITPRLLLRQPIMGFVDAPKYSRSIAESIKELRQWLPWAQYSLSVNQAEEYIRECCANWILKNNNVIGLPLWIVDVKTQDYIGHLVMWNIVWEIPKFEFGFWVDTAHTHKGYMTEAVNALTRYCFYQLKAKRVEINCEITNIRSQAVPRHLGFDCHGVFKNNAIAVSDGNITDTILFSCTDASILPDLQVTWG